MRRKPTSLRAIALHIFTSLLPLCANAWSANPLASPALDYESEAFAPVVLHLRRQETTLRSNGTASNSTLQNAVNIVTAAQEECRAQNARLLANPRTNNHAFRVDSPDQGKDPVTGTAVNKTVADAAALVAEAVAKNGSLSARSVRFSRQASSYWMPQMTQNGQSPYVADSSYKVSALLPKVRLASCRTNRTHFRSGGM